MCYLQLSLCLRLASSLLPKVCCWVFHDSLCGFVYRKLAEKHQQLLRKFDRESKANKRLSMDNEELSWRLSIGETGSPDPCRRSVSHSPTHSEASTPEPHRRSNRNLNGRSPLPHNPSSALSTPRSPRSPRNVGASHYDFEGVVMRSPRSPRFDSSASAYDPRSPTQQMMTQSLPPSHSSSPHPHLHQHHHRQLASPSSQLLQQQQQQIQEELALTPTRGNLKRSGTYDLLDQSFDESEAGDDTPPAKQSEC